MILGLVVALGTTKLTSFSLALILCYVILQRKRLGRITVPLPVWILAGSVGITALWSPEPGKPVYAACVVLACWIAFKALPRRGFLIGVYVVVGAQIGIVLWQYVVIGESRPAGISRNASVIGVAGLMGLPVGVMAISGGLSLSRTAMIGAMIVSFRNSQYRIAGISLIVIAVSVGAIVTPERLFKLETIEKHAELRIGAIKGNSTETLPGNDLEVRPVEWRWQGYGWGNYYFQTGRIQPHNVFVKSWYEMGVLVVPFWGALVWLWWRGGKDWWLVALMLTVGMLTDELVGSVEGVYMLLGYAIINSAGATSGLPTRAYRRICSR